MVYTKKKAPLIRWGKTSIRMHDTEYGRAIHFDTWCKHEAKRMKPLWPKIKVLTRTTNGYEECCVVER